MQNLPIQASFLDASITACYMHIRFKVDFRNLFAALNCAVYWPNYCSNQDPVFSDCQSHDSPCPKLFKVSDEQHLFYLGPSSQNPTLNQSLPQWCHSRPP